MTEEKVSILDSYHYEMGPIRPPSEASSLLIRVTRNCEWNRCLFCPVYKETEFSVRPLEHVIRDIDLIRKYVDFLLNPTDNIVIEDPLAYDSAMRWVGHSMKSVFLQDADSLAIGADNLAKILTHLKSNFSDVERVTSYSRSSTINKMSVDDLAILREAGLTRIHVGLESGSDRVLKMVRKGASKDIHIQAGLKVKEAGMELSEYFMPGLGGRGLSAEHAIESADALNKIDPDFIRLRPLAFPIRAPLYELMTSGKFDRITDVEMAKELVTLIENLEGISSYLVSDHILNLFADLKGRLPDAKDFMLSILQRFLGLNENEQLLYRFGRRLGVFTSLDDLNDKRRRTRVLEIMSENDVTPQNIDYLLDQMMRQFI
ncbi:MAG: radical SAM protein [Candidatus Thorarchaeota archaeon SMTZ1-45]|nr:MAG: coproporphyrinogen III oxidase [Candidatus Thorarchaeota archaeon SMTZ1-45]